MEEKLQKALVTIAVKVSEAKKSPFCDQSLVADITEILRYFKNNGELHKAISDHMAKVADTNVVTDKFKQYLKDDFEFPKFTPENFDGMANTLIDGIFE